MYHLAIQNGFRTPNSIILWIHPLHTDFSCSTCVTPRGIIDCWHPPLLPLCYIGEWAALVLWELCSKLLQLPHCCHYDLSWKPQKQHSLHFHYSFSFSIFFCIGLKLIHCVGFVYTYWEEISENCSKSRERKGVFFFWNSLFQFWKSSE